MLWCFLDRCIASQTIVSPSIDSLCRFRGEPVDDADGRLKFWRVRSVAGRISRKPSIEEEVEDMGEVWVIAWVGDVVVMAVRCD